MKYVYTDMVKITIVGDQNTGKSFFCKKLLNSDYFETIYSPTLGVDFFLYRYKTKSNTQNKNIQVNLWDLSGNPKFFCILNNYLKQSNFFLLFCDVTNIQSVKSLQNWIEKIRKENTYHQQNFISIICTKNDKPKTTDTINNLTINEYIQNFTEQFHNDNFINGTIYYIEKNTDRKKIIKNIISEYFKFNTHFPKSFNSIYDTEISTNKNCWIKFTECIKNIFKRNKKYNQETLLN